MLLSLPPELFVSILKYLPLSDISACVQTSKLLKDLVDQHESTIYRQATAHPSLNLIPHDQILFSEIIPLGLLSKRYLGDANDWKDLCRRACQMRSCWLGKGPSRIKDYYHGYSSYPNVHRIKVDEKRGFIITTHGQHIPPSQGRLVVSDIDSGQPIWGLDSHYVRQYAHCEYGEGFLIFDRSMDAKEVWRLVSVNPEVPDPEAFEIAPESRPDEVQLNAIHITSPGARLKFVPHALLHPPDNVPTRAFRFVYPTLMVAATTCLLLWDVRTGQLVERMNDIATQMPGGESTGNQTQTWAAAVANSSSRLGRICYVEVNNKYALVCGERTFKMFQRQPSQSETRVPSDVPRTARCVMAITRSQLQKRGRWIVNLGYVEPADLPPEFEGWDSKNEPKEMENGQESDGDASTEEESMVIDWEHDESDDDDMDDAPGNHLQIVHVGFDLMERRRRRVAPNDDHPHPRIQFWKNSGKAVVTHQITLTNTATSAHLHDDPIEHCLAAHVSPCGQHLAILADTSRLLIIPYFERILDGRVKDYHDIMIDFQIGPLLQSIYLAYEENRIGVVTQMGLFIIHPTFPPPDDFETPPKLHVQRVALLNDPEILFHVSCLQMTPTSIWINWEVEPNRPSLFSSAWVKVETDEEIFEENLNTTAFLPPGRWPDNSIVVSVDFGLGSE